MAEYYPLMSRAVAGLRTGTPEARQAIYGRAKQALVTQLRSMDPPVPESDLAREVTALDDAIARVEREIATQTLAVSTPAKTEPTLAASASVKIEPTLASSTPPPVAVGPPRSAVGRSTAPRPAAPEPVAATRPSSLFSSRPDLPQLRSVAARAADPDAKEGRPRPSIPIEPVALPPPPVVEPRDAPPQVAEPAANLPAAPTLAVPPAVEAPPPPAHDPPPLPEPERPARLDPVVPEHEAEPAPPAPQNVRAREEGVRPVAPRLVEAPRRNLAVWIVAAAALAAVFAIAFAAWKLRDRPEELARVPAATQSPPAPSKIVERADGSAPPDAELSDAGSSDTASGPSPSPVAPAPAPSSPPAAAATPAAAPTDAPPTQAAGDPSIPVAYKAAVLVDAPDTAERVKTYVGTVVWRTESVGQGQDQPLGTAVRAEVDVPEAKMQVVMEIRKNNEAQFPASHTVELKFTLAPDSPLAGVKQISVPQMRRQDAPTGDALMGVPVAITDNHFLVGLTRGDSEPRNVDAIRSREWFDIPLLLTDNRPAKITFEKGALGDRIIGDALQAWNRS